eukprot:4846607-Alexandrium_andersonii.AAC.1
MRARECERALKTHPQHCMCYVGHAKKTKTPLEMLRKQICDCMLPRQFRRGAGARNQLFAGASTGQRARRPASARGVALSKHAIVGA